MDVKTIAVREKPRSNLWSEAGNIPGGGRWLTSEILPPGQLSQSAKTAVKQ